MPTMAAAISEVSCRAPTRSSIQNIRAGLTAMMKKRSQVTGRPQMTNVSRIFGCAMTSRHPLRSPKKSTTR
jgi:hypothetical protein